MAWKIDRVDETSIDVTKDNMIEIRQIDPTLQDAESTILLPAALIPMFIEQLQEAYRLATEGPVHGSDGG